MSREPNAPELVALIVADVFELNGLFQAIGDEICRPLGQTQARWAVLSVISDGARSVAQIARRLGLTRQSVQRTADQLAEDGLVIYRDNPDHQRSPLVESSARGTDTLSEITRSAESWNRAVASGVSLARLTQARQVLRALLIAARETAVRQRGERPRGRRRHQARSRRKAPRHSS